MQEDLGYGQFSEEGRFFFIQAQKVQPDEQTRIEDHSRKNILYGASGDVFWKPNLLFYPLMSETDFDEPFEVNFFAEHARIIQQIFRTQNLENQKLAGMGTNTKLDYVSQSSREKFTLDIGDFLKNPYSKSPSLNKNNFKILETVLGIIPQLYCEQAVYVFNEVLEIYKSLVDQQLFKIENIESDFNPHINNLIQSLESELTYFTELPNWKERMFRLCLTLVLAFHGVFRNRFFDAQNQKPFYFHSERTNVKKQRKYRVFHKKNRMHQTELSISMPKKKKKLL